MKIPSVYIDCDTKRVTILDHVDAKMCDVGELFLHNPTSYDAVYKVLAELSGERKEVLTEGWFLALPQCNVKAGSDVAIKY